MKHDIIAVMLCLLLLAIAVVVVGLLSGSFFIGFLVVAFYALLQGVEDFCR